MLIQHIIIQEPHRNNIYYFRPAMAFLLHKVSGATLEDISRTRIYSRTLLRYIPFYRSANGGGAITLGSGKWCSITYTENFFSDNNSRFANRAYANRLYAWIRLSAHEAGHIIHARRYRFFFFYLIVFGFQYLRYGHNRAPLEIEADHGVTQLEKLRSYLNYKLGPSAIENLFVSDQSEQQKVETIELWWQDFMSLQRV